MATNENPQDPVELESKLRQELRHITKGMEKHGVLSRITQSTKHFEQGIHNAYKSLKKKSERSGEKVTPEDMVVGLQASLQTDPVKYSPGAREQYEDDLQAIDLHELIRALFSPEGEPMDREQTAKRIAEMDVDPHQSGITRLLRVQSLAEKDGITHEDGPLLDRVSQWRNSEAGRMAIDKKGMLKIGQYAMMTGIIIGTGGAAVPGMVMGRAISKMNLTSHLGRAGEKLYGRVTDYMTSKGLVSQAKMDEVNTSIKNRTEKFTHSKVGKISHALGAIALVGTGVFLAGEAMNLDGVANAWSGFTDSTPDGLDAGANPPGDAPQATAETNPDAVLVGSDEYTAPEHFSPEEADLIHPHGGIDRDALLAQINETSTLGHDSRMVDAISQLPEQATMDGIRESFASFGVDPSMYDEDTLVRSVADILNVSQEALNEGLGNAQILPPDTHSIMDSVGIQDADAVPSGPEVAPNTSDATQGPGPVETPAEAQAGRTQYASMQAPDVLGGGEDGANLKSPDSASETYAAFDPPDIGGEPAPQEFSTIEPGDPQQYASLDDTPSSMSSSNVTVDIQKGDTLSEIIVAQYAEAGINVTSDDLYGPDGLVAQIAEQNGIDNSDLIHEGGTLSMTMPGPEGSSLDPEAVQVASSIGEQAQDAQMGAPGLNEDAIAAASKVAEGAGVEDPDIVKEGMWSSHDWRGNEMPTFSPEVDQEAFAAAGMSSESLSGAEGMQGNTPEKAEGPAERVPSEAAIAAAEQVNDRAGPQVSSIDTDEMMTRTHTPGSPGM